MWILLKNSLKFGLKVPINHIPALVRMMARRHYQSSWDSPYYVRSVESVNSLMNQDSMNRQTISIYIAKIVADILVPILRQTTNNHTNITLTVLPPGEIKDQITYLFPNFNGAAIEVWEWISNFHPAFHRTCAYLSMLGLKLSHVSKMSQWCYQYCIFLRGREVGSPLVFLVMARSVPHSDTYQSGASYAIPSRPSWF